MIEERSVPKEELDKEMREPSSKQGGQFPMGIEMEQELRQPSSKNIGELNFLEQGEAIEIKEEMEEVKPVKKAELDKEYKPTEKRRAGGNFYQ